MHTLCIVLGMTIYGLARATQQALLFTFKDNEIPPEWVDAPGEIHLYGWFEPLGLFLAGWGWGWYLQQSAWYILLILPMYAVYWLPYAWLFNKIRGRRWFYTSTKYKLTIFKREYRFNMLSRSQTFMAWLIAMLVFTILS